MATELKDRLASLHAELVRTRSVDDPELRQQLIELLGDITRLLGKPTTAGEHDSLIEQLDALAVRFEADHPALGNAIRQVVDALGKAGI
ncbi:MAG TPA: DUF4404 family protein [Steroidobacteraceae bacterium]|nr:DUF4404 family protein [Steroidobacteraceae bacterium]